MKGGGGGSVCTAACGHALSTGHGRSRWPGIVDLNGGERERECMWLCF